MKQAAPKIRYPHIGCHISHPLHPSLSPAPMAFLSPAQLKFCNMKNQIPQNFYPEWANKLMKGGFAKKMAQKRSSGLFTSAIFLALPQRKAYFTPRFPGGPGNMRGRLSGKLPWSTKRKRRLTTGTDKPAGTAPRPSKLFVPAGAQAAADGEDKLFFGSTERKRRLTAKIKRRPSWLRK